QCDKRNLFSSSGFLPAIIMHHKILLTFDNVSKEQTQPLNGALCILLWRMNERSHCWLSVACFYPAVGRCHTIVGYQFHYLSYCTWDGPILFGEDLYVLPEFRGRGIGTSLLNKVAKVSLEGNCFQFRFVSAKWNQAATDFFSKLGAVNVTSQNYWNVLHVDGEHVWKLAEEARRSHPK
uniref:N-acetyltransferase domain-containing protein n=1 Tax=Varanus komodoensis TaxID=61221 RepID=A0A8D2Q9N7_VARKO